MLHLLMDSGSSPTNLEGTRRVDELRILTSKYISINLRKSQVSKIIGICQGFGGNPYICTFRVLNFLPIDQVSSSVKPVNNSWV